MYDLLREELIKTSDVIVIKVGTNVLSRKDGHLNIERIERLAEDISRIFSRGRKLILVSSGAVGAGMGRLNLHKRPTLVPQLQAVAAIGQSKLIEAYEAALGRFDCHAAQVLLTADDLSIRRRYLNARNALRAMLDFGAIPIVNENDTVSVHELHTTFGDNDRLASLVAGLFDNPLLILLTDVNGLYDRNPAEPDAQLISIVDHWTEELMSFVVEKNSQRSRGGMASKLAAAKIVTESGGNMLIANGDDPEILRKIFNADDVGTLFLVQDQLLNAKKRWIGFAGRTSGSIYVDAGAAEAVAKKRTSLLSVGILNCDGSFEKGDLISMVDPQGREFARGLCNYRMTDVMAIRGKKSDEIQTVLGRCPYEEVVHRDNIQVKIV